MSSCCLKRERTRSGYSARALKEETNQQSPGPLGIYQYILCTYHITMIKKKNMYQIISYNVCIPYKENIYIYLFIYSLYIIYIYIYYMWHYTQESIKCREILQWRRGYHQCFCLGWLSLNPSVMPLLARPGALEISWDFTIGQPWAPTSH